jgi:hypothetical protein
LVPEAAEQVGELLRDDVVIDLLHLAIPLHLGGAAMAGIEILVREHVALAVALDVDAESVEGVAEEDRGVGAGVRLRAHHAR